MTENRMTTPEEEKLAQELADLLDQVLPPGQHGYPEAYTGDPTIDAAVELAQSVPPPMPNVMKARIRTRMMKAHVQQKAQQKAARNKKVVRPQTWAGAALRWTAAMLIVLFFFNAAMAPVVAASVPGDLLYDVKRGVERVEIILANTPQTQATVYLNQAERRIDEAEVLIRRGQFDETLIYQSLDSMVLSGNIVREYNGEINQLDELEARTESINDRMDDVVMQAKEDGVITDDDAFELAQSINIVRQNGCMLMQKPTEPLMTMADDDNEAADPVEDTAETVDEPAQPTEEPVELPPTPEPPTDEPVIEPTDEPTEAPPTEEPTIEPTDEPTEPPTEELDTAEIESVSGVNVRSGPGLQFSVIKSLLPGDSVTILGLNDAGDWANVQLEDGTEGWVAAYLLMVDGEPLGDPLLEEASDNTSTDTSSDTTVTGDTGADTTTTSDDNTTTTTSETTSDTSSSGGDTSTSSNDDDGGPPTEPPGHDPDGPGNSENAPGQNKDK